MKYIQLTINSEPPDISGCAPFKAILVIENQVSEQQKEQICEWLVNMGGLYIIICSSETQSWKNSIRQANLSQLDIKAMSPDNFVMISEHKDEQIRYVFWHAKKHAKHTHVNLINTVVVHVSDVNRGIAFSSIFNSLMKT